MAVCGIQTPNHIDATARTRAHNGRDFDNLTIRRKSHLGAGFYHARNVIAGGIARPSRNAHVGQIARNCLDPRGDP